MKLVFRILISWALFFLFACALLAGLFALVPFPSVHEILFVIASATALTLLVQPSLMDFLDYRVEKKDPPPPRRPTYEDRGTFTVIDTEKD